MIMYVFRIRKANEYSIRDLLENKISASTPECFDDETEMEWRCNYDKIVDNIMKMVKNKTINERHLENLFYNYKELPRNKDGLKAVLMDFIKPEYVSEKKSLLVSCFSNKNIINNDEMWNTYTNNKPLEGILLVYNKEELISKCNDKITYGDVNYNNRILLNTTNYWTDWVKCFCKFVDYNKTNYSNQMCVNEKMKNLNHSYTSKRELVFTKDIQWKKQSEWRITKENINYCFDKNEYCYNGKIINNDDKNINKCKHGYTIKCKPVAIYIRKGVSSLFVDKTKTYALKNNIQLFFENTENDNLKFIEKF